MGPTVVNQLLQNSDFGDHIDRHMAERYKCSGIKQALCFETVLQVYALTQEHRVNKFE